MSELQVFLSSVRNYQNVLKRTLIRIGIKRVLHALHKITEATSAQVLHASTVCDLRSFP
jgi:hypothetical protein